MVRELVGVIRSNAKDLGDLIAQNGQTQLVRNHYTLLETLVENAIFPSMDEVAGLHRALIEQIRMTGEVSLASAVIIDRAGLEMDADVLFIGPFTSMYRTEEELGFLNYSFSGNKLYALSHLPPGHMQKDIDKYMRGEQERVPVDISKGAALRQLSYQKNLVDQIRGGTCRLADYGDTRCRAVNRPGTDIYPDKKTSQKCSGVWETKSHDPRE